VYCVKLAQVRVLWQVTVFRMTIFRFHETREIYWSFERLWAVTKNSVQWNWLVSLIYFRYRKIKFHNLETLPLPTFSKSDLQHYIDAKIHLKHDAIKEFKGSKHEAPPTINFTTTLEMIFKVQLSLEQIKVKVKLSLYLTKQSAMKTYSSRRSWPRH
jgi:hypothetical protein